jgi:integrase
MVKRTPGFATSTKQGWVVAMHRFHQWGAMEGHWELNGIMAVETPRPRPNRRPPVSTETARRIIEACETPLQYRVAFYGLYAGCRIGESAAMRPEHWKRDRLYFMGKGAKWRSVPVHPELARARDFIHEKEPSSAGVCHSTWARLRDRLGFTDLYGSPAKPHALRKAFATNIYQEGQTPREVVAELLGHAQGVTDLYAGVSWTQMLGAVESLDYWGGEPVQLALFGE